jgi:hypothetical protein
MASTFRQGLSMSYIIFEQAGYFDSNFELQFFLNRQGVFA